MLSTQSKNLFAFSTFYNNVVCFVADSINRNKCLKCMPIYHSDAKEMHNCKMHHKSHYMTYNTEVPGG